MSGKPPGSPLTPTPTAKTNASAILFKNANVDEKLVETIRELEKQLEFELKIQEGAENLIKGLTKKKDKEPALKKLEETSRSIEKLREKLAALNKKALARHGCHSITDLVDMIESTRLTDDEIRAKIDWVQEKVKLEMKVKAGAENLAKVYGADLSSKKLMGEIFSKLKDSTEKLNLLKVAMQKYKALVGETMTFESEREYKFTEEELRHWKRTTVTGKLKLKIVGATELGPPHKKLDAKCVFKVDSKEKAKTGTKSKTNKPLWNEEFEVGLEAAGDLELHLYDKSDLYSIFFFDLNWLVENDGIQQEMFFEMEPRGILHTHVLFTKKNTLLKRKSNIGRRGAVKTKIPSSIVRFLGFENTVEIQGTMQKENSMRKRTQRMEQRQSAKIGDRPPPLATEVEHVQTRKIPKMDDFLLHRVLGKGNFGKVMLVEEKATGSLFAIKVLKKEFVLENDETDSLRAEKRVFQIANKERHPFLVKLHSCFTTEDRLCFVMEYVSGGDLMWHIQRQLFNETRAKLYACEVLLALEYLHSNNIVYRDLKLDNILMDADGHIKMADYGLCKEKMPFGSTTHTFCGTPEFMAPEILLEQPYGKAVDWWAFGVLIYEMILAQSPFKGEEEEEIFDSILDGHVHYPAKLAPEAVSILQQLLERDPKKRLGGGPNDAQDVKNHPYFKDVDWQAIMDKKVPIEYKPQIKDAKDTTNFDPEFTKEVPQFTPIENNLMDVDQEEFEGFSYVAEWAVDKNETAL